LRHGVHICTSLRARDGSMMPSKVLVLVLVLVLVCSYSN
jgi:hypothetical protein